LVDSITPSASGARESQKNARTFPQNSEVEKGFFLLYVQRKIDAVLTYYFCCKQHGSFKFNLEQENVLKEIQETVVNKRTAGMLNPAKQATLKCTENKLKQRMSRYCGQRYI